MSAINDRKTTGLECSFCTPVSRRDFVRTIGAGASASAVPIIGRTAAAAGTVQDGPTPKSAAETAVARFYKTLTAGTAQGARVPVQTTRCGRGSATTGRSSSPRSVI